MNSPYSYSPPEPIECDFCGSYRSASSKCWYCDASEGDGDDGSRSCICKNIYMVFDHNNEINEKIADKYCPECYIIMKNIVFRIKTNYLRKKKMRLYTKVNIHKEIFEIIWGQYRDQ